MLDIILESSNDMADIISVSCSYLHTTVLFITKVEK